MKKYIKYLIVLLPLSLIFLCSFLISFNNTKAEDEKYIDNSYVVSYIYVDIKGAVKFPNVYRVTAETRLFQLVEMSGGLLSDADIRNINLSARLTDEESIYIPFINDDERIYSDELINLNTATVEQLDSLPGIGIITAQNIIDYRNNIKVFQTIEEIMNVSGIGEASFAKIKDYITV